MDLNTLKLSPVSHQDLDLDMDSPDSSRHAPRDEVRWDPDSQEWAEAGFFPGVNLWELPKFEMINDFLDQNLDLQGSHRVWENKEDVLVFLQECGLIPSYEETQAWIDWKKLLHRMEYTSEWESIDGEYIPSYIKEELSWQEVAEDAEVFEYMMFNHRLSACEVEVAGDTADLDPLHLEQVECHIKEVVYNDKTKHLAHFLGLWDGGVIYFPKTMGSQIVKAQVKWCVVDQPACLFCPEQAVGRVSCHPDKPIRVNIFQTSADNTYPWRAEWIHS